MTDVDPSRLTTRWLAAAGLEDPRRTLAALADQLPAVGSRAYRIRGRDAVGRGASLLVRVRESGLPVRIATVLEAQAVRYVGDLIARPAGWLDTLGELWPFERRLVAERLAMEGLRWGLEIAGWPPTNAEALSRLVAFARDLEWRRGRNSGWGAVAAGRFDRRVTASCAILFSPVQVLGLPVPMARDLRSAGFVHVGDAVRLAAAEVFARAGLSGDGARTLDARLAAFGLSFGMTLPGWPPPDLPALVDEASRYLSSGRSPLNRPRKLAAQGAAAAPRATPARPAGPPSTTVDEELSVLLDCEEGAKRRAIVAACFGWDGEPPRLQRKVATRFGVSLAYVQEVCREFRRLCQVAAPATPRLDAAFREIVGAAPSTADEVEARLGPMKVGIEGLLAAARVLGRPVRVTLRALAGRRVLLPRAAPTLHGQLLRAAGRAVQRRGVVTVDEVRQALLASSGFAASRAFVEAALAQRSDLRWLESAAGRFWLCDVPNNPLTGRIMKIVRVAGRVHVGAIADGVRRPAGGAQLPADPDLLLALCRQLPGLRVEGREVSLETAPEPEAVLGSRIEAEFVDRFRRRDGPVPFREIADWCRELGIPVRSGRTYVRNSPLFSRVGQGVYALRSSPADAPLPAADRLDPVERTGLWAGKLARTPRRSTAAARSSVSRGDTAHGGFGPDGRPWLAFTLSASLREAGLFPVPQDMREVLAGGFLARDLLGRRLHTVRIDGEFGTGLSRFYFRYEARLGDAIALVFDLERRVVSCAVNSRSLAEAVQAAASRSPGHVA